MPGFDQVNPQTDTDPAHGSNPAYDLKTDRFQAIYVEHLTELLDLGLAGPFYAIQMNGQCDYLGPVFKVITRGGWRPKST
jgi:hypothetical protein